MNIINIINEEINNLNEANYTVYHGTHNDFNAFDDNMQGISKAFFFSDNPEHALKFSRGNTADRFIITAEITLNNPLVMQWDWKRGDPTKPEIVEKAKAAGYDGMILDVVDLGVRIKEYVVFDKRNIKIINKEKVS